MADPVVLLSTGDVVGPNTAVDGTMVLFDGTSGKRVKGNGAVVTTQGLALLDDVDPASNRATIGLNQVNNTSDIDKPVSTAQQAALNLKADSSSLGTAAYHNAQTAIDDQTPGAVLTNGSWGLGGDGVILPEGTNLDTVLLTGYYRINAVVNGPAGVSFSPLMVVRTSDTISQTVWEYASGIMNTRTANLTANTVWRPWVKHWDTATLVKTTGKQDETGGSVLTTGAYGLGHGGIALPAGTNLDSVAQVGIYRVDTGLNIPTGFEYTTMLVMVAIDVVTQFMISNLTGKTASRALIIGSPSGWGAWNYQWGSANFDAYGVQIPVGVPFPWPTYTPPPKCTVLSGQAFDTLGFPELAAVYPTGVLPDLRGESIRGLDAGRGVDPDYTRPILSFQVDTLQNMTGEFKLQDDDSVLLVNSATGVFTASSSMTSNIPAAPSMSAGGFKGVTFNPSAVARVSTETRMRNVAFYYICRMY